VETSARLLFRVEVADADDLPAVRCKIFASTGLTGAEEAAVVPLVVNDASLRDLFF
jgi:hypothetical protein